MVTPSHHRAHHGLDEIYLDHNYGGLFIIWDRIFGTFSDEGSDRISSIGLLQYPNPGANPIGLALAEWRAMFHDVRFSIVKRQLSR